MSGSAVSPAIGARRYLVRPAASVHGELTVPGDKSISHRALMLGGIAEGATSIRGFLASEDCLATLAALGALGVAIERPAETQVRVQGVGRDGLAGAARPLDMGNAGTAIRLLMGLLAGQRFDSTLIGDASLMRRPMERVAAPLRAMGARIDTEGGRPPVKIHGGAALHGIDYALPMASAQVKSALLLAGLYAQGQTRVTEPAPTRDHTERMLRGFGVQIGTDAGRVSLAGGQRLRGCDIEVPGDFSSAAFFIVAGCLAARQGLTIRNVGINPTRTGLLQMLRLMGADIDVQPRRTAAPEPVADIHVRAAELHGIRVPEALVPLAIDEFPVFFIAAAAATGETVVTGAAELRVKESDRLAAMAAGLATLGIECELLADGLRVRGGPMRGGRVDSHGDHRIAMAFAIASLCASEADRDCRCGQRRDLVSGFSAARARRGPGARGLRRAAPGGHHRWAERLGQRHRESAAGAARGWHLLDSGALYRLVAFAGALAGLEPDDSGGHARLAAGMRVEFAADPGGNEHIMLDGREVSAALRTESAGAGASRVAAWPAVRAALLDRQRAFARPPGLIADGRDMGTVVFPAAQLKIFLTASSEERARRRYNQLKEKDSGVSLAALSLEIAERDRRDSTRSVAPLLPAADAIVLDSTALDAAEVADEIFAHGRERSLWA